MVDHNRATDPERARRLPVWRYGRALVTPVYLDFDGVLNSFSRDVQRLAAKTGFGRWEHSESRHAPDGESFAFTVSVERNDAVAGLADSGGVIRWLTTWWQAPLDPLEATGIDGSFLPPLDGERQGAEWKATVIRDRHPSGSDRFVWLDDDAIPKGFGREYPEALLVRPSAVHGLFRRDLDRIVGYLDGLDG